MKKIIINEKPTMRGLNREYYLVEIYDNDNNRLLKAIAYPRRISRILHETSIWKFFKPLDNQILNDDQCEEYVEKLKDVIKRIKEIEKIY